MFLKIVLTSNYFVTPLDLCSDTLKSPQPKFGNHRFIVNNAGNYYENPLKGFQPCVVLISFVTGLYRLFRW